MKLTGEISRISRQYLLRYIMLHWSAMLGLAAVMIGITGCEIVDKVYVKLKQDVQTHMFPEDIVDESPPLGTDTYICDNARTVIIHKNKGAGSLVVEYEGRSSFLQRVEGTEDEIYKNNQTTLRLRDDKWAELARQQVPILTNCERQYIQTTKRFVN